MDVSGHRKSMMNLSHYLDFPWYFLTSDFQHNNHSSVDG